MVILHLQFLIFTKKLFLMRDARGVTIDHTHWSYHSVVSTLFFLASTISMVQKTVAPNFTC